MSPRKRQPRTVTRSTRLWFQGKTHLPMVDASAPTVANAMMAARRAAIGDGVLEFEVAIATTQAGTRKAAEDTPLSTLLLAGLFHQSGLPKGCFNVVTGSGRELGQALITHPVPRKVAFTGGTETGKAIAAAPKLANTLTCTPKISLV